MRENKPDKMVELPLFEYEDDFRGCWWDKNWVLAISSVGLTATAFLLAYILNGGW